MVAVPDLILLEAAVVAQLLQVVQVVQVVQVAVAQALRVLGLLIKDDLEMSIPVVVVVLHGVLLETPALSEEQAGLA